MVLTMLCVGVYTEEAVVLAARDWLKCRHFQIGKILLLIVPVARGGIEIRSFLRRKSPRKRFDTNRRR